MTEIDANLIFLPWVRRGAAAALLQPDTLGAGQPGLARTSASLQINSGRNVPVPVTVMGPGHVTGLDTRQVIRTDPAPGSRSFEPNYFPLIEFDEPSLPWLFTPAGPDAQARLRPWLCLVVIRIQDGVSIEPSPPGALPMLRISAPATLAAELPDPATSWAWAHAQVTAGSGVGADHIPGLLAANPSGSLSRLVCPRVLQPGADYLACVVPAFELGRKAGLGLPIGADDEAQLAPAWNLAAQTAELPVYYSWQFATGPGGDFQSLALLLRARPVPSGLGTRDIDISQSGLPVSLPAGTTLSLPGALRPTHSAAPTWPSPTLQSAWETELTTVLNTAADVGAATGDPVLAPPLYGAAQAGLTRLDAAHPARWFEQLNLAPTYRAIAHLGARVVQDRQEELMASAWAQAADLTKVNRLLRQAQLGCLVADSMHVRHIARMDADAGLQVLAPALARMTLTPAGQALPTGLTTLLHDTGLDTAAFSATLRRVARPRGAINRRIQRVSVSTSPLSQSSQVLSRLQPAQVLARRLLPSNQLISLETVAASLVPPRSDVGWARATAAAVAAAPPRPWFAFVPMGTPVPAGPPPPVVHPPPPVVHPPPPVVHPLPGPPTDLKLAVADSHAAQVFRNLAGAHLARFNPARAVASTPPMLTGSLATAFTEAVARTAPAGSFAARARAVVSIPGPARDDSTALAPVGLSPSFPQPMSQPLAEIAQDLMLPGLDLVPPDTALPLQTCMPFVEAYLVGLNTEFGRELLWRGYPADAGATYFDQFWESIAVPAQPDIDGIAAWGDRALGAGSTGGERFVLLLRSELLRRYPDAVIYATRPGPPVEEQHPIFIGRVAPDITYLGFGIGVDEIAAYSIVIQEHPSAPRFGIEVTADPGTASHLAPTGSNAAVAARATRQMPVRVTIPYPVLQRQS